MRVIAFTGLPGAGKSEAVRLAAELTIPVVRMGDFVLAEVEGRGLSTTEEHVGAVATGMRAEHGDDVWAQRTVAAIRDGTVPGIDPTDPVVVVDGVRSLAEIERFRAALGQDFLLIAITAPAAVRHERILGRGRSDDAADIDIVRTRDARERSWGLEEAIASADRALNNDATVEEFRTQATTLLKQLLAEERRA